MDFAPEFGKVTGQPGGEYRTTFAWVALIWHVSMLVVLYLTLRYSYLTGGLSRDRGGS